MPKKQRYRTKEARELADEVTAAGGTVELNAEGHLRVTGPQGTAIVGSKLSGPAAHDTARSTIARHAGIIIRRRGSGQAKRAGQS